MYTDTIKYWLFLVYEYYDGFKKNVHIEFFMALHEKVLKGFFFKHYLFVPVYISKTQQQF